MGRAPCCDKTKVKRGPWSSDEDAKLKSYIQEHGTGGNWITLPQKIGLKRCGKSCRLRWLNYLRPNIKHGGFSDEEDDIICTLYMTIGSRWSIIAAQLPGRTDNDIKNYWNTKLKKKLTGKHRKEVQLEAARRSNTTSTNYNANNNTIKNENYSIPDDQAITHDQYYWPQHRQQLPIYSPEALSQQQDDGIINTTISNLSDDTILTIPLGEQVYGNYYTNIMLNSQLLLNAYDIQDLDSFLINGDETRVYDPMANAVPCGVDMVNSSCSTINSMNNNNTPTESTTSSWTGDMQYSFRCPTISSYENSYNTHDGMRAFEDDQQGYLGFQW